MYTGAISGTTSAFLASFYNSNQTNLNDTMVRISSGNRLRNPADNAAEYFHASAMRNDVSGLQSVDRGIVDATGMITVAEQAGQSVLGDVSRMKELVNQYYSPSSTAQDQTGYQAEFSAIKNRILTVIANTTYAGKQLIADGGATPLRQVVLDPRDVSQTLDISFDAGDVADVNTLTLGTGGQAAEQAAADAGVLKAGSYLAKTTGYLDERTAFHNIDDKKETTCQAKADDTENIDGVAEAMQLSKQQISQQMTISMMAQANMVRSSVLSLLGIK